MVSALSIVERFINHPIALAPNWAGVPLAALSDHMGMARISWNNGMIAAESGAMPISRRSPGRDERPPYGLCDGVALIPIYGLLLHKLNGFGPALGMTGYDEIRYALTLALDDDEVDAIVLDIDSPGGEVAGLFDLTDEIFRMRGKKPVWGVLSEMAASAAYAIAAATSRVTIPRTGVAGSIGIVAMHVDMSRALDKAGVTVSLIQYGARKSDGIETSPLAKEARRRMQADVDTMGDLFVASVARYRGRSSSAIRAQEASTYLGGAAVQAGLADAVMAPDAAVASLIGQARRRGSGPGYGARRRA